MKTSLTNSVQALHSRQIVEKVGSIMDGQSNANTCTYIVYEDCRECVNKKKRPKPRHFSNLEFPARSGKKWMYSHPIFIKFMHDNLRKN